MPPLKTTTQLEVKENIENDLQQDHEAWLDNASTELEKSPCLQQLLEDLSDAFLNGSRADFMEQMETVSILAGHI